jgi:hypothetical protein
MFPLQACFRNHGWLTPAAPGCTHAGRCRKAVAIYNTGPSSSNNSRRRRISSQICDCDLQRCFVSHGGLTPPALGAVPTFAGEKTIFAMHERTFTRAAGVSPPWFGEPSAVPRKPRNVRRPCDAGPRAAGVNPPWVCKPRLQRQCSEFRGLELVPDRAPRGAYALPATARVCQRKKDLCDVETHFCKSGGREPAVGVGEAHLQERFRKVAGDCRRCAHERRWSPVATGGLRPPLLLQSERLPAKNDFCDARTHIHKSGGREPAVVR